ncbi:MarR family winged helix-turn-helix transcriptional regulator [Kribbella sp. NPDC026611]|uniref:MarR family winged helix-turn-helix transcriptional regulator n=1 Tax=Kribbella sp. NPDC026611 TaxID=3154911 RepID=UPI0033F9114B
MERNTLVRALTRATVALVGDAQRGMARAFDVPRVNVLRVVGAEVQRPSVIGERLGMAPSSVTRNIQALEDAGQVTVEIDPDDGRTCLVSATAAGLSELQQLDDIGATVFGAVVEDWSDSDIKTLTRLLERLTSDWAQRGPSARRRTRPTTNPRWRHRPEPADERD